MIKDFIMPSLYENLVVQFVPKPQLEKNGNLLLKTGSSSACQNLEPKSLLSRVASRDFAIFGKFSPLPAK